MHKTPYKTLCVAVLFVIVLAFMSGSKSVGSAPPSLTAPVIVASGKLLNQSGPFTKTIYTPGVSGVFRLSVYATITTVASSGYSYWMYNFSWTDVTGQLQTSQPVLSSNTDLYLGEFADATGYEIGGATRTFQAVKDMPITHSVSPVGAIDGSAYDVYYVLERIE